MEIMSASRREKKATSLPHSVQMTDADRLSSLLVRAMRSPPVGRGLSVAALGDFFAFIPSRIGHNRSLDAAVYCLVQGHQSLVRQWPREDNTHLEDAYLKALRNLQLSLDDPTDRGTAETLCGALVLALYELFRPKGAEQIEWVAHAGGAAAILRARGPNAFTTDFEQSLLLAHHGSVVKCSIFQRVPCYLNTDAWLATLERSLGELALANTDVNVDRLYHSTVHAIGTLPDLIHRLRLLGPKTSAAEQSRLLQMVREFKSRILALAQLHETEFFDGQNVVQQAFNSSQSDVNKRENLFPPPLPQWSDDTLTHPFFDYGSQHYIQEMQGRELSEISAPTLEIEFSSRYAARRHLHYWEAVILSNILLLRLEAGSNSAASRDIGMSCQSGYQVDNGYEFDQPKAEGVPPHVLNMPSESAILDGNIVELEGFECSQAPNATLHYAVEAEAANRTDLRSTDVDLCPWKQTENATFEMRDQQSIHLFNMRPVLAPLIPSDLMIPRSSRHALPSPGIPFGPEASRFAYESFTMPYRLGSEDLGGAFPSLQNPLLPSPPDEFPSTTNNIDSQISSHQAAYHYARQPVDFIANPEFDHQSIPSTSSYNQNPQSSAVPPPGFLTSSIIPLNTQNAYLHSLILRSLPYVHRDKPLGAIYMLGPLQMAAAISTPEQKEWIVTALNELFGDLHLRFSRDKTWTAPTWMDDVDQIAREAGVFYGEWQ
ncbi:MAG: hypothetical protein Q9160_009195 [Pyrenula sp. 1 TL-2023]